MTHTDRLEWNDFASIGQGPIFGTRLTDSDGANMSIVNTLTDAQTVPPQFGVLPSAVSAGFDERQLHSYRREFLAGRGYGINVPYPYPNTSTEGIAAMPDESGDLDSAPSFHNRTSNTFTEAWWIASGVVATRPPDDTVGLMAPVDSVEQTGVLHYNGAVGRFSSAIFTNQITDFAIFNPYIHHERIPPAKAVAIPYISTYRVSPAYNTYEDDGWIDSTTY